MPAGTTRVQDILDALAVSVKENVPGITSSTSGIPIQMQKDKLPYIVFSWFSDIDSTLVTGSTQKWNPACKATIYYSPIVGNDLSPNIAELNNLIHDVVDQINKHPQTYPYGSAMSQLTGVDRITVTRVRTSEFGLSYAGSRYTGAELFLDIKMHRKIDY